MLDNINYSLLPISLFFSNTISYFKHIRVSRIYAYNNIIIIITAVMMMTAATKRDKKIWKMIRKALKKTRSNRAVKVILSF